MKDKAVQGQAAGIVDRLNQLARPQNWIEGGGAGLGMGAGGGGFGGGLVRPTPTMATYTSASSVAP